MVTVQNALTDCEAAWLESFVACMHEELPLEDPFYQERPFGDAEETPSDAYGLYNAGGGNYVTFLAGLLQKYLPGIVHSLYHAVLAAYDVADWGQRMGTMNHHPATKGIPWPHPMSLGLRTAEYLKYQTMGQLGLHGDFESVYTISVALSDPTAYEGGYFTMQHSGVLFKLPRLSAVVFRSEDMHGITPLTSGERRVFVIEFWPWAHVPMGFSRPGKKRFKKYMKKRYGKDAAKDFEKYNMLQYREEDGDDEDDEDDDDETEEEEEEETEEVEIAQEDGVEEQSQGGGGGMATEDKEKKNGAIMGGGLLHENPTKGEL